MGRNIFKVKQQKRQNDVFDAVLVFFIVNSEHISHFFVRFLLLTLNKQMLAGTGLLQRAGHILEIYGSVRYWPERALFYEKRALS